MQRARDEALGSSPKSAHEGLAPRAERGPLRQWIVSHDDSRMFVMGYLVLAVVLSVFVSLFWLVAVVGVHFMLEWLRHRELGGRGAPALAAALWETKLDVALVIFSFALVAYMDVIMGMAGLGGAARLGAKAGSRFAVWEKALRGVLLSVDDAAQVARNVLRGKEASTDAVAERPVGWSGPWSWGDRLSVGFALLCALLLAASPVLTHHSLGEIGSLLLEELRPLPS